MSTLDNFRKEAKHWLRALRSGVAAARPRFERAYPHGPREPGLRDVQHALAREHGFENWVALKAALTQRRPVFEPPAAAELEETFLSFACWDHNTHGVSAHASNEISAMRLLRNNPALARQSLHAAIVCGELAEVRRRLSENPSLAAHKGGPRGWEPLTYLCYARLPLPALNEYAVALATLLLDLGANPNGYYMAGASKYSALVGVAGEGEQDAPRGQPYKAALYRLLLDRGAGPYDIQVLYNTHFSTDMTWWLELTYEHDARRGDLSAWQDPAWRMLGMGGYGPGAFFVLHAAIAKGNLALAEWALGHGARPDTVPSYHPKFNPARTLYQEAVLRQQPEMAALLQRYGAAPVAPALTEEEQFIADVLRVDRAAVDAHLHRHPEWRQSPAALFAAAESDRADAAALLLDLGVPIEIEGENRRRALHVAAGNNALRVAQLLIDRGAQIDPRETQWNATPIGIASYGNDRAMIDLLAPVSRSVWTLTWLGKAARLQEVLAEDPELAREQTANGASPLMWLPDDDEIASAIVELLLARGADPSLRTKHERMTAADYARRRGLARAAARLAAAERSGNASTASDLSGTVSTTPSLERFDKLARDLVRAYEAGQPEALREVAGHFGGDPTWEQLREGVSRRLAALPEADRPPGYFALPHARLVIARHLGATTWDELVELLIVDASRSENTPIPQGYRPDTGPAMIEPVEIRAGLRVKMRDGTFSTTTDVWSMLNACRTGDLARVMELAAAQPALVLCDYNYMPPLHLAVREGHLAIVTFLAGHGAANPNHLTYPYRETLPTVARDRGYEEIAQVVESWYAREDRARPEEEGGEFEYVRDDERIRFQKLVNVGALAEVEELLRRRPDLALDELAFWSEGILSMPANRGNRAMLELLMRYGARVPEVTKWGAWYYFKRYDIAAFLVERGMNPNHMNCHHTTLLHDMAYTGDVQKAMLLLDSGAEIDAIDEEFRSTPLGLAVRFGKPGLVELLLERGADPNAAGAPWATPLEWARKKRRVELETLLRSKGARG
ncbi:MAG TPA: ankyrin repeat domain-containing protein [Vicinamibacterales bacterium]|nr:ankyrin repeat domain-containing protein [Vicinamibacterales bacterium]